MKQHSATYSPFWAILLLATSFCMARADVLFVDDFIDHAANGELADSSGWMVYGGASGSRQAKVVYEGDPSPYLRIDHDGSDAVLQVLLRDAWPASGANVISVSFDFVESSPAGNSRFSLRAGQNRVFSNDRTHEVRFQYGRINNSHDVYHAGRVQRVTVVFNNSIQTLNNYHQSASISPDTIDVWVNGERVIASSQYLRGNLAVGQPLTSVTFDLPAQLEQTLLVDRLRIKRGAHVESGDHVFGITFEEWIASQDLPAGDSTPAATPAGDSMPNLLKFAMGVPASQSIGHYAPLLVWEADSSKLYFDFLQAPARTGVAMQLEYSTDLHQWQPLEMATIERGPAASGGASWYRASFPENAADGTFIRLSASNPTGMDDPATAYRHWASSLNGNVVVLPDNEWSPQGPSAPDLVIIPPVDFLDPEHRDAVETFRRNQGNVFWLGPDATRYEPVLRDPVTVFTPGSTSYSMLRPTVSAVNPTAEVTDAIYSDPDLGTQALAVWTRLVGDGNVLVEIPLASFRAVDRSVLRFQAKGEYDMDILYLVAIDTAGRQWTAFRHLPQTWTDITISLADFIRSENGGDAVTGLQPADLDRLRLGIGRFAIWPEVSGAFSLGRVQLGREASGRMVPSGELASWRVQLTRFGMEVPPAWNNPFQHAQRHPGYQISRSGDSAGDRALSAPFSPPTAVPWLAPERGRENTELRDILQRDHYFRRSLLELQDAPSGQPKGSAVELRYRLGGDYSGSVEGLFAWAPASPYQSLAWANVIEEAAARILHRPHMRNIEARTYNFANPDARLRVAVRIENPEDRFFFGRLILKIEEVGIEVQRDVSLPPQSGSNFDVFLGNIAADFPMDRFQWSLKLSNLSGKVYDEYHDDVDMERMIAQSARYFLDLQKLHRDARMSHHAFADVYAVRFLSQFARYLEERPQSHQRIESWLGGYTPAQIREAAFAWIDRLVEEQSADGTFPMGYGEHRGVRFTGDLGQIAFGITQISSWLDASDPRRSQYLDFVRNFMEFRQSMYMDEERAAQLEAQHGPNPETITAGFYGMGLLDSDYFDGGSFPGGLQREERGRWWVLPITMSGVAALSAVDDTPLYREIALRDINFYLDEDYALSNVTYYHIEALLWMYFTIDDNELRQRIRQKAAQFLPTAINGLTHDGLSFQGRAVIRLLSLLYYERYIESSPKNRALMLQNLWNMDMKASSYSLKAIANKYPRTSYGPSIAAFRFHAHAAIWMLEWLDEGASLLKERY